MKTLLKIVSGFALALIGAMVIHVLVLEKQTDVYTVAYCAPQAIVAPVFFLNSAVLADNLYYKENFEAHETRANFDLNAAHSKSSILGAGLSAVLTALFWIPFFFFKRDTKLNHSQNAADVAYI